MRFSELGLQGVQRIEHTPIEDHRGFFARLFCEKEMSDHGVASRFVQCNNTLTKHSGTVRGLHFQRPPSAESKLVRCIHGAVWDVAIDLRADSTTYGQHVAIELNADNRSMICIPEGFGHGFQTLLPNTELLYFHSEFYSGSDEGGVNPLDPALSIDWPLPVLGLSDRDRALPALAELEAIEL